MRKYKYIKPTINILEVDDVISTSSLTPGPPEPGPSVQFFNNIKNVFSD